MRIKKRSKRRKKAYKEIRGAERGEKKTSCHWVSESAFKPPSENPCLRGEKKPREQPGTKEISLNGNEKTK